ncbi:MAG TPA: class II glutamine amidotransferase [Anaeromyxobacter sp.]
MCRLFGQHAHPGLDLSAPLCSAENALRFQSHKHPHGWGIGWYEDGVPVLRRGVLPAHADDAFLHAAAAARSAVVLAHVRDASIGPVSKENTHPFQHGRWLFAHNGTVARYKKSRKVREAILAEIDVDLRAALRGETDSERCFLVFLTRLRVIGTLDGATLEHVRRALAETTAAVTAFADPSADSPSTLNFLVSDGRLLAASRHGKTLHLAADAGPRHVFALASERIGAGAWEDVAEGGFVGTEDGLHAVRCALRPPPHAA